MVLGPYYKDAAENLWFEGVTLHRKDYGNYSPIDPEAFYRTLKESIESMLLDSKNADLAASTQVLAGNTGQKTLALN
jgi:hypothetical protein